MCQCGRCATCRVRKSMQKRRISERERLALDLKNMRTTVSHDSHGCSSLTGCLDVEIYTYGRARCGRVHPHGVDHD